MGHGMGERRKGGSRDSAGRRDCRSGAARRGTRKTPRLRGDRSSGAQVVHLHESRRRRGATGAATRGLSTGNAAWTTGRRRLRMVAVAFAVVALLLGGRAVQMIVADDERYQAFAAEQGAGWPAPVAEQARGSIVSADGRELATSLQAAQVVATPYQIEKPAEAARALAGAIGPKEGPGLAEIEASLTVRGADGRLGGYSVVASGVGPETAGKIEDLGIEGITVFPDTVRVYPERSLASQLIGHLGGFGEPVGGLEASYDGSLKGGGDVALSLDTAVQRELEKALKSAVEKNDAKGALGLVLRVEDGAIVALANTPSYDNNRPEDVPLEDQRNRILTDPYEPGSTFKAITVASPPEEGAVTEETPFVVADHTRVADRVVHA